MPGIYEHLRIEKEPLINNRRTKGTGFSGNVTRDNPQAHGQQLKSALAQAAEIARSQPGAEDGRFVLKLNYSGNLDFSNLTKHGVEFLSQEDKAVCIVFTSEQGLAEFADHLSRLGVPEGEELTYRQILLALDDVGNWSREDRESWAVKKFGIPHASIFKLDVELWPLGRQHSPERMKTLQSFDEWLTSHTIRRIDKVSRDSLLLYRVEVDRTQADLLFEHRDVRMVDLLPRTGITYQQMNVTLDQLPASIPAPISSATRICILDSGINSNHPLLKSAFGEEESYVEGQGPEDEVGHGTAVAGIVLYGDLENCLSAGQWKPEVWLFSGKVMKKASGLDEAIFDSGTIEHVIEKAVEYFADEHGCRIFNLSLGNENSPYDGRHIRGLAYTLDRLAREYNVLFVVSAGNFRGTENIPKSDWRSEYPEYLLADESLIIDPAPALNVITVGALANHTATAKEQRYEEINELSPAAEDQPAPFTRHGPSIKGAIKPDLVAHGGNLASPMRREGEQHKSIKRYLGVLTLNHNIIGSTLLKEISGTSFAAPYITHLAGRLLNLYPTASANLLRALLVNHSDVPESCHAVFPGDLHKKIHTVVGYGKVDTDTLFRSTEYEAVLMSEDTIQNNTHQFYELPLPESFLRSNRAKRQLRVTLAYSPPVRTTRMEYAATKISFCLVRRNSLEEAQRHFKQELKKEVNTINDSSTGNRRITSQDREKCTVQSSIWEFNQLKPKDKWFVVVTRQDKEWGIPLCEESETYALVVTLNDRENQEARIYSQIQARIQIQEHARERDRVRQRART